MQSRQRPVRPGRQRPPSAAEVEDLARQRLDALLAELAGERVAPPPGRESPELHQAAPEPTVEPPRAGRHAFRSLPRASVWGGWLEDRLPDGLRGRVRLGGAHVGALALLLSVGVLLVAWGVARGGEEVVPAAAPVVSPGSSPAVSSGAAPGAALSASAVSGSPTGGASPASSGGADVVVDVQGAVRKPGIVVLPSGSRVVDALREAGGYTGKRHLLRSLNLARLLVDGEQVVAGQAASVPGTSASAVAPGASPGAALVSLNSADQTQLETLPGVGPVTAAAILQWRADNGAFTSVDQLIEVSGIGEKTLAQIAPFVTL